MPNTPKTQLYYFHKNLNRAFNSTAALLNAALPELQAMLKLDRIYFFNWSKTQEIIALTMVCKDGYCMDMQENISTVGKLGLIKELLSKGYSVSHDLSYPAVYVILRWKAPAPYAKDGGDAAMEERIGVLRLERFSKARKFTDKDIEIILELAGELSDHMLNTEIDQDNGERLRLATSLNSLAAVFASSLRFNDAIEVILKGVQKAFKFDRVRMYLFDYKGAQVRAALSADVSGKVVRRDGEIPAGEIKAVNEAESYFNSRVLNLPLNVGGKRVGILIFDNLLSRRNITYLDFLHVKQFSSQIALAVDNAVLFERVQDLYNYDDLTKLPVRRYFNEKLSEEIYRSKRFDLTMSVVIIDIDFFKNINDSFGHYTGDLVLKQVSEVILKNLRQTDFPCRYGGDEIMLMLPRTNGNEAKYIAKRIAEKIKNIRLPHEYTGGKEYVISITQGIAVFPQDAADALDLFNKADAALYYAKLNRGTYALYNEIPLEKRLKTE